MLQREMILRPGVAFFHGEKGCRQFRSGGFHRMTPLFASRGAELPPDHFQQGRRSCERVSVTW